jgi:hypothetical protein
MPLGTENSIFYCEGFGIENFIWLSALRYLLFRENMIYLPAK